MTCTSSHTTTVVPAHRALGHRANEATHTTQVYGAAPSEEARARHTSGANRAGRLPHTGHTDELSPAAPYRKVRALRRAGVAALLAVAGTGAPALGRVQSDIAPESSGGTCCRYRLSGVLNRGHDGRTVSTNVLGAGAVMLACHVHGDVFPRRDGLGECTGNVPCHHSRDGVIGGHLNGC